jgi:AraC-like DNA-binding protein
MSTSSPLPLVESGSHVAGASASSRSAAFAASNVHYLPFRRREDVHHPGHAASDQTAAVGIGPAVAISPREVANRRARTSNGLTAEIIQVTHRERIDIRFRAPFHLLVVVEQGGRVAGETLVEGCPRSTLRDLRRKLTFVPAGHAYHEWQDPSLLLNATYFYLDPARLPAALEPACKDAFRAPRLLFEDAALWETALKLRRLLEAPDTDSPLCFEALGVVLAHELARANAAPRDPQPRARGGLAGWQRRIVTEFIEGHVSEQIPLAKLAQLVQLSPYHFCRAFKQSFGLPPHRYHTGRRIERAKALLAQPNYSVTEIGLSVGFSETSSFTAAFRKATGLTPTAYHRTLG